MSLSVLSNNVIIGLMWSNWLGFTSHKLMPSTMYLCPTVIVITKLMLSIFLCSKVKNRSLFVLIFVSAFNASIYFLPLQNQNKLTKQTNNRFHLDFLPLQVQRGEVILSKIVLSNFHPKSLTNGLETPQLHLLNFLLLS